MPRDRAQIIAAHAAHFHRVVAGAGNSTIALEHENMEALGRERQRDQHVDAFIVEAGCDLRGRRHPEPCLPAKIQNHCKKNGAPLRHAERTCCSTFAATDLNCRSSMSASQARGRESATSICACTRPLESTTTRSARNTASSTSWVMNTMVGRR